MKKTLLAILVLIPVIAFAGEWYAGGNLHSKMGRNWVKASYSNRLATCADFVLNATPKSQQVPLFNKERVFKQKAIALEACISETTKEPSSRSMQNAEIAAACLMIMGYR